MRHVQFAGTVWGLVLLLWWSAALPAAAQEDDELILEGLPMENVAVGRDLALRLRAEIQISEDDDELVEEDLNYERFPLRIYSGEMKLYQKDRLNTGLSYSFWENDQGLDARRWYWKVRVPLGETASSHLSVKYRKQENEGSADRDYWYVGLGRSFDNGLYAFIDYRHATSEGRTFGDQLSGYLSWKPTGKFRVGSQAALSRNRGRDDLTPWYARFFTTVFVVPDRTSVRLEAQHYQSTEDSEYRECNAYLYQKVGARSLLRLGCRFYDDDEGLTSRAWGIKAKRYFSARLSGHVGYRAYDHSEGADFDTLYAGMGWLL
jgi:hypothetical protein